MKEIIIVMLSGFAGIGLGYVGCMLYVKFLK